MRPSTIMSNGLSFISTLLILTTSSIFTHAQQQEYQANLDYDESIDLTGFVQGIYYSCSNPAENGPFSHAFTSHYVSPNAWAWQPYSGIRLIKEGDQWIPASSTLSETVQGGTIVTTAALNSSGIATWTETTSTPTNSEGTSSSGTTTAVVALGDGNLSWQERDFHLQSGSDSGCSYTYTETDYVIGSGPFTLVPYATTSSLSLTDPDNGYALAPPTNVDPNSVPAAVPVSGISADGASVAAVVFKSNSSAEVAISLTGAGVSSNTDPGEPIGTLTLFAPDYLSNPQPGNQTSVTVATPMDATTCNPDTDQAGTSECTFLALLWAPKDMPYGTTDKANLTPENVLLTLTATQVDVNGTLNSISSGAQLLPPPVVLIHGFWSSAKAAWPNVPPSFLLWLRSQYATTAIVPADYGQFSQYSFESPEIQNIFSTAIANAVGTAESQGIVARKIDVVAHSMGGLVTLYYMDHNSFAPIHKLVTIGIPHDGSPLASTLWTLRNTPPPTINGLIPNPLLQSVCSSWGLNLCTPTVLFSAIGKPINTAVESLQNGLSSSTTSYSAIVGEPGDFGATESILDAILALYAPGSTVSTILGVPNDTIVPYLSQSSSASDSVTVDGVVHTSLIGSLGSSIQNLLDFPGETSGSAVWNQALSSLMGNSLSGIVLQTQADLLRSRNGAESGIGKSARAVATPLDSQQSMPAPIFDLTGYTHVPISNASFLPASGSTLTINSPATVTVSSPSKTIVETILVQNAADPTDFAFNYSTQAPFSMFFTPTRLGSMSFVAFAVFADKTFATTTLNYTLVPNGTPIDVRLSNPPSSSLGQGQNVIVNAIADFTNGPVDVTSAAAYSARSGGTSVFSIGANGSITATGNGVDWLDASYQSLAGSALISVGHCSYTLTPKNQVVDYGGASVNIEVSTQSGCAWTASSDSGWLIFSDASGSGSATIAALAAANATGTQRSALVTVGNVFVTITQPATACSYIFSPSTISLPSAGGSGTIFISTSCPFTSSSDETWATVTTLSQSAVAYYIAANSSQQSRTATLNIGKGQVTIAQSGAFVADTPTLSPAAGTYTSTQSVTITDGTSGATIYYTTNGATPTALSTKYSGAITVSSTETIEAVAVASGFSESTVASATYTIKAPATGLQFIPVTPCRVADTRNATGPFGGPELSAGSTRSFAIPQSACGIPSTAVAYSLNATVIPNTVLDYLTLWPSGEAQPNVSTLNSLDGRIKANAAIVPAGTNGSVSVYVTDATQVILDIDGYFVPTGTASALAFYPLTPCRVADTRNTAGPLGGPFLTAKSNRAFPVQSSSCNIPATAQAYSLNVTSVPHKTLNYLTTWPTGEAQPTVSTLNAPTGAITANAAIVSVGTNGDISIYVSDDTDIVLDVNGYFAPAATGGLSLYTVAPCRVIDTRPNSFNGVLDVDIQTNACAPPQTAQAYVLNATVVPPNPLTYLTLWPDAETQPVVSTLNALDGAVASNMAIVPSVNGSIDAFASNPTHLILDISSYFAP